MWDHYLEEDSNTDSVLKLPHYRQPFQINESLNNNIWWNNSIQSKIIGLNNQKMQNRQKKQNN